jgi:pimeloyl-ACP methyl ester carboxylesterase
MNTVQYVQRPEGRIAYEIAGAGPLVICMPGMGDLRSSFRFLAPALVNAGYQVATADLRGHGDSDATFSAYDDVAAGSDLLALIDALGAGPAVLIGNSMAAGAAVWAAAEQPASVAGLVLLGPFVREVPISAWQQMAFRLALLKPWGPAAWTAYYPKFYADHRPADLADHQARIRENLRKPGHWKAFVATTRTSHAPVEARLGEVQAPALVIMGERDPDFPDAAAEARLVADRVGGPGSTRNEVVMVPGSGHYPQADSPEVIAPAITNFLGRVLARG